jgi:hypothetical protein
MVAQEEPKPSVLTLLTEGELTMSVFTIHTVPGSPFARAVLATLEEKKAPYRVVPVVPGTLKARRRPMQYHCAGS